MTLYAEKKLLYNRSDTIMGGVAVNCMKCGRDTKCEDVFCKKCLEHMEKYPVPENMLVYVPSEKDRAAAKKHSVIRPVVPMEEQLKKSRRKNHILSLALIFFVALSIFFAILSIETIHELNVMNLIGRNYTTITATEATD